MRTTYFRVSIYTLLAVCLPALLSAQTPTPPTQLPNGKLLGSVPGNPRETNNFPTAIALSPDGRFAVLLHSGFGAYSSGEKQSLSVLNLATKELKDFPDDRLGHEAHQTYFLGLTFSLDGKHLYASMASLTDPLRKKPGDTCNGIAVYSFDDGRIAPERFIPLPPRVKLPAGKLRRRDHADVTYPAGLTVGRSNGQERILVACNASDEAILLNAAAGKVIRRFDLSAYQRIPGSLPYTAVMTSDGKRGFVSLWNASAVAELNLLTGRVLRTIPLLRPAAPLAGGSHPTALLLSRDNSRLFVALTNRDEIAVLDTASGKLIASLSTKLPGQKYGGSDPESLALSSDEKTLFSANSISDSVAVFDLTKLTPGKSLEPVGFIPTEWYPTLVASTANELLVASAKGRGSGPNPTPRGNRRDGRPDYPYNPAMTHGSLAFRSRISLRISRPTRNRSSKPIPPAATPMKSRSLPARTRFIMSSTSSKKTAPTIRSSATWPTPTATLPSSFTAKTSLPTSMLWHDSSASSIISTTVATFPVTATSGPIPPPSPTMSRRPGPSPTAATSTATIPKALS